MVDSYMRVLSSFVISASEVGLEMRLGGSGLFRGPGLPILGGRYQKNGPVHSFFILLRLPGFL